MTTGNMLNNVVSISTKILITAVLLGFNWNVDKCWYVKYVLLFFYKWIYELLAWK